MNKIRQKMGINKVQSRVYKFRGNDILNGQDKEMSKTQYIQPKIVESREDVLLEKISLKKRSRTVQRKKYIPKIKELPKIIRRSLFASTVIKKKEKKITDLKE